ncbi:MAG TPA: heavy metal transporter [Gammaproteobacteria bacterium]|nr:heavy metal transporter [Gammaproteobacteria bacterium]
MKKLLLTTALLVSLSLPAFAAHPGGTIYADVNGLVCDFCARALEKVFGKQEALESINVDLDEKVITVHFNEGQSLNDETITQLITDAGYNVREIRHGE